MERYLAMAVSNHEFAERVGCDFTTASRYRNGLRVPSARMLARIMKMFPFTESDVYELWEALDEEGGASFGRWLREKVFDRAEA